MIVLLRRAKDGDSLEYGGSDTSNRLINARGTNCKCMELLRRSWGSALALVMTSLLLWCPTLVNRAMRLRQPSSKVGAFARLAEIGDLPFSFCASDPCG